MDPGQNANLCGALSRVSPEQRNNIVSIEHAAPIRALADLVNDIIEHSAEAGTAFCKSLTIPEVENLLMCRSSLRESINNLGGRAYIAAIAGGIDPPTAEERVGMVCSLCKAALMATGVVVREDEGLGDIDRLMPEVLDAQKRLLILASAVEALPPQRAVIVPSPPGAVPEYLQSWLEILDALGKKNNRTERDRLQKLNETFVGPIISPGQGKQPLVVRGKLLAWYESLEERFAELEQRKADARETVADRYQHGRNETVVPDIGGHVKKRRKPST